MSGSEQFDEQTYQEDSDIYSPAARNRSNQYKSDNSILKDLKRFVRFLSQSDTHYQEDSDT
jgi:hypothetical protein